MTTISYKIFEFEVRCIISEIPAMICGGNEAAADKCITLALMRMNAKVLINIKDIIDDKMPRL